MDKEEITHLPSLGYFQICGYLIIFLILLAAVYGAIHFYNLKKSEFAERSEETDSKDKATEKMTSDNKMEQPISSGTDEMYTEEF